MAVGGGLSALSELGSHVRMNDSAEGRNLRNLIVIDDSASQAVFYPSPAHGPLAGC